MLKPSPLAPLTPLVRCRILLEAGMSEPFLSALNSEDSSLGEWLLEEPDIDFYTFTGSTNVGRPIAAGASAGGRALCAEPFDARALGDKRLLLRPPMTSMSVFGVAPQIGPDLQQFIEENHSIRSFVHVARRVARNWFQRVRYQRGPT